MYHQILINILSFYGCFLITCGVVSVIFIGKRAKTALLSGGISGFISLSVAFLISQKVSGAEIAGFLVPTILFVVFSWRSTQTLFSLAEMIAKAHEDLKMKGIAFMIISLMAVVSLVVLMFQFAFWAY
jgi:hypothetical protein